VSAATVAYLGVAFARIADDRAAELEALLDYIAPRFGRAEPRRRARLFVRGMLSGLWRMNGWTLAEYSGDDPHGMQRLLNAARWDVDGVRDDLRSWVVAHLGDGRHGILVAHEAPFRKKGSSSVGVHRRYNERADRVENVQVGVFLTYLTPRGTALLDRRLYLPESWIADRERRQRAGVPDEVEYARAPQLVLRMVEAALGAGVPARWVAADRCGNDAGLRSWLEGRDVAYVLATARRDRVTTATGQVAEAHHLAGALPRSAWERRSPDGRVYEWARIALRGNVTAGGWSRAAHDSTWEHWLLLRRCTTGGGRPGYYRCRVAAGMGASELIGVARALDGADEWLARSRQALGLGQYQVRRYDAWYRHVTLCMVAGAHLAVWSAKRAQDDRRPVASQRSGSTR
jgi:SRSO17 transposase